MLKKQIRDQLVVDHAIVDPVMVDPAIVNETIQEQDTTSHAKTTYDDDIDEELNENFKIMENYLRNDKNILNQHKNQKYDENFDEINQEVPIKTLIHEDGTTSTYFDKRKLKIAPRSTLQFKVGPSFELVGNYNKVFNQNSKKFVNFQIIPRIDRGFDFIEDQWVGYKRNYFTLVASFDMDGMDFDQVLQDSYTINAPARAQASDTVRKVKYFAIKIRARSDEDYSEINLIQHTAKRDKGPQFAPQICPLIPSPLPKHQIIREASNVRNVVKKKKYDSTFFFHREEHQDKFRNSAILNTYPDDCIQKVARFERIQFASSINVKNPPQKGKYFRLHVVLGAVVDHLNNSNPESEMGNYEEICSNNGKKEYFIPLQEMRTPQLIIRGRSPSNYTSFNKSNTSKEYVNKSKPKVGKANKVLKQIPKTAILNHENIQNRNIHLRNIPDIELYDKENIAPTLETKQRINDSKPRSNKRVVTLEQIEEMILQENSVTLKKNPIKAANFLSEKEKLINLNNPRPVYSRHYSIDPRDIDLKFENATIEEDNYMVGSLIMHNIQLPSNVKKCSKKGDSKKMRTILTTPGTTATISAAGTLPMLHTTSVSTQIKKTSYRLSNNFKALNSSFDFESSPLDDTNTEKSLILLGGNSNGNNAFETSQLRHIENVPRLFNKDLNDKSFSNSQYEKPFKILDRSNMSYERSLKIGNNTNFKSKLPSQMNEARELFSEPSFYNH